MKLKHEILETLKSYKSRYSNLISLYIPLDYSLNDIIKQLTQEQRIAFTINPKRQDVTDALEKIVTYLDLYRSDPSQESCDNGLAIFCGNISTKERTQDLRFWAIEPTEPIKLRIYQCDQTFVTEPLEYSLKTQDGKTKNRK